MDWISLIGLLIGWGAILLGLLLEGIELGAVFKASAFFIVVGGSIGAAVAGVDRHVIRRVPHYLFSFFRPGVRPTKEQVLAFYDFSNTARREGILSLEDIVSSQADTLDEFTAKGLQLVVDGVESDTLQEVLEEDIESHKYREMQGAELFEAMGAYAPTIGILGTIMGMLFALNQLGSADTAQLGHLIGVAFVATFYGLFFANMLFLPVASKLKHRIKGLEKSRLLSVKGLLQIQSGVNPRVVVEQLSVFLEDDADRREVKAEAQTRRGA